MTHTYLIALGSNMRVPGVGAPRAVLGAALEALEDAGFAVLAAAPIIDSDPIGPSLRRYANSACVVESDRGPLQALAQLQKIERQFGRTRAQRRGQRWRARALDLDIALWSGGCWQSSELEIPHRELLRREFVLRPASAVAPHWIIPGANWTVNQAYAKLKKPRPRKL